MCASSGAKVLIGDLEFLLLATMATGKEVLVEWEHTDVKSWCILSTPVIYKSSTVK